LLSALDNERSELDRTDPSVYIRLLIVEHVKLSLKASRNYKRDA